jgi:hypothetical protein
MVQDIPQQGREFRIGQQRPARADRSGVEHPPAIGTFSVNHFAPLLGLRLHLPEEIIEDRTADFPGDSLAPFLLLITRWTHVC